MSSARVTVRRIKQAASTGTRSRGLGDAGHELPPGIDQVDQALQLEGRGAPTPVTPAVTSDHRRRCTRARRVRPLSHPRARCGRVMEPGTLHLSSS